MVDNGRMGIALFTALDTVHVALPTLRSISEKIPQILTWILCHGNQGKVPSSGLHAMPSMAEMEFIMNYHWPRNWRQLQEVARQAVETEDWNVPLRDLSPWGGENETIDSIAAIYILSMAKLAIHKDKVMEGIVAATNLEEIGLLDLAILNEAVSEMAHSIELVNKENETAEK
jgi:transcriptional regulator of acetoin/glycerol metabolism